MKRFIFLLMFLFFLPLFIKAEDIKESKSIVVREITKLTDKIIEEHSRLQDAGRRNVIAVMKFKNKSKTAEDENIGDAIAEVIQVNLAKSPKLIVMEHDQVARLLKEIEMGMTGMIDEKHAKMAGRMVSADMFVFGSVTEIGNLFVINTRVVEVESAKTLIAEKIEIEKKYLTTVAGAVLLEPKAPINAGLYSAIIPGWGQFYNNHNTKGVILLSGAVLSIGGMITCRVIAYDYQDKHDKANNKEDAVNYFDKSDQFHNIANYCFIGYLGIWAFGILDAIISAESINSTIKQYKQAYNYKEKRFFLAYDEKDSNRSFTVNFKF